MGKISKGFGSAIKILGILCLIAGICISCISWELDGKIPTSIAYHIGIQEERRYNPKYPYWWGGLGVSIKWGYI